MGKIFKTIIVVGIFLFCAMFILRIGLADYYPAEAKAILDNEALKAAYSENGGKAPEAFLQEPVTPYDNKERAHFFFNYFVYIPDAKQVQLTLRYNNSTLEDIKNDMKLDAIPAADTDELRFYLRDASGEVYPCTSQKHSEFLIYNYKRLVFDGIDLALNDTEIGGDGYFYLDVYYGDADVKTDVPYGSMLVFVPEKPVKPYTLPEKLGE